MPEGFHEIEKGSDRLRRPRPDSTSRPRDPPRRGRGPRPRRAWWRPPTGSPGCTPRSSPGLHQDPAVHLTKVFTQKYDELVLIKDIRFESTCEHHLLPFIGKAHVAYIPNGKVVGLSKIPRVIDVLSKRPQLQERLTEEVADLLMSRARSQRAWPSSWRRLHTCMTIRGVHKPGSTFITSALRGACKDRAATRAEVLALINDHRS